MKLALKLREALLCSSMLLNSEAWSDVREAQIGKPEVVDRALLRFLVKAHLKDSQGVPVPRGGRPKIQRHDQDQEDDLSS